MNSLNVAVNQVTRIFATLRSPAIKEPGNPLDYGMNHYQKQQTMEEGEHLGAEPLSAVNWSTPQVMIRDGHHRGAHVQKSKRAHPPLSANLQGQCYEMTIHNTHAYPSH
ncbi:hypothetical protein CDAR_43751 [Caerostris darwini]|uniref:Uncharacterized protein n=1 Tax=Caerostris darwini TaxID=1538125 RepID=A0AAV4WK74_9ARAC|nr:hypothetical protein CDAR_43751 [Caerostris darwini]